MNKSYLNKNKYNCSNNKKIAVLVAVHYFKEIQVQKILNINTAICKDKKKLSITFLINITLIPFTITSLIH